METEMANYFNLSKFADNLDDPTYSWQHDLELAELKAVEKLVVEFKQVRGHVNWFDDKRDEVYIYVQQELKNIDWMHLLQEIIRCGAMSILILKKLNDFRPRIDNIESPWFSKKNIVTDHLNTALEGAEGWRAIMQNVFDIYKTHVDRKIELETQKQLEALLPNEEEEFEIQEIQNYNKDYNNNNNEEDDRLVLAEIKALYEKLSIHAVKIYWFYPAYNVLAHYYGIEYRRLEKKEKSNQARKQRGNEKFAREYKRHRKKGLSREEALLQICNKYGFATQTTTDGNNKSKIIFPTWLENICID